MPEHATFPKYKYIYIERDPDELVCGKSAYYVHNRRSNDILAQLCWYPSWRRWVAEFVPETLWSADCLADVQDAIGRLGLANR